MTLTRADVEKISLLGRLRLTSDELDTMTAQLGAIMHHVEQLGELNTEGVEPMAHALDIHNVFADDVEHQHLPRAEALANSPKHDGQSYRVPAVLGD